MTALGHLQTFRESKRMSALPLESGHRGHAPPRQLWAKLTFTSSSELNDFLNGDVAKHGRPEQGLRRYYAARRWRLPAASRITSYTRRGWESIGT